MQNNEKLLEMKQKLRDLHGLEKHSLHINDHHYETFRIASSVLNKNSVNFLNTQKVSPSESSKKLLEEYFETNNDSDSKHNFCIDGSIIMDLCGIRTASDLDYVSYKNIKIGTNNKKISIRNKHDLVYHCKSEDDIIFNPANYFYFNGFKFITLQNLYKMKKNRNEPKDTIDCEKIKNINILV